MAEQALTAILSAQQTIAAELEEVANALEDVAEDAGITGETMERVEDATDGARNAMGQQVATLQAVEEKFEGASIEAKQLAMTEDQVAEAAERVRNSQSEMAAATDAAETKLSEEASTFREALLAADSLAEAKQAASESNQVLSATAKRTQRALEDEIGEMYQMVTASSSLSEFIDRLRNSQLAAAEAADQLEEQMSEASVEQLEMAVTGEMLVGVLNQVEDELEEVDDEATETALSMAGLSSAFAATSLNIGPFNFALKNAATKIPQLVAVSGSLITALGGVATAATTAGGALMGIFGGGVLAMAERMAATSDEFKNRWEAIQGVFKQVRSTLVRALEPLMNQQSIEMFQNFITGLASALNMAAQMAVRLQNELRAFGSEISAAFFSNANEIFTELENTVEAFLPILADFARWFFDKLPAALRFFQDEGVRFTKALARFGQRVINFFRAFSEFGISAMEGILPAIGAVIEALSMVVDILNMLPEEVIAAAAGFLLLSRAMEGVVGVGLSLGQFFTGFTGSVRAASGAVGKFGAVLAGLHFSNALEATSLLADKLGVLDDMYAQTSDTARSMIDDMQAFSGRDFDVEADAMPEEKLRADLDEALSTARTRLSSMKDEFVSTFDDIATATRGKMDDIAGAIIGGASAVRESMGEVAGTAIAGFQSRLRAFNVDDTFQQQLATDVALGGPRITRDVPEVQVHTKTGRARQKLANFRSAIIRTGGRVRTFTGEALAGLRRGFESLAARGIGVVSLMTGIGEAAVSAVPGLGNFERAVGNIQSGLETISPTIGSFINRQVARIPRSMDEANQAALGLADSLNARLTPYLDSFNERALRFADGLNARMLPVLDSANDRLLNFADALDPQQDLTFYDIAADKMNTLRRSARSAGETIASSLLGIDFTDSGIRNLRTGQFTSFGNAVKDRALAPVRLFSEGLSTATTRLGEYKQALVGVIPTMTQMNNSALGAADAVDEAISPALDTANDRANSFADRLNARLLPVIDSANDRMLNFADALDPNKDLTFYDIFAQKLGVVKRRAISAGQALTGSLLGISFEDAGIRDLKTGQFTTFSNVIRNRLATAAAVATSPLRRMGSAVMAAGGAIRGTADDFAAGVASIESYDDAMSLVSRKARGFANLMATSVAGSLQRVSAMTSRVAIANNGLLGTLAGGLTNQIGRMVRGLRSLAVAESFTAASTTLLRNTLATLGSGLVTLVTSPLTLAQMGFSGLVTRLNAASIAAARYAAANSGLMASLSRLASRAIGSVVRGLYTIAAAEGFVGTITTAVTTTLGGLRTMLWTLATSPLAAASALYTYATSATIASISTTGLVQSLARVSYTGTGAIASMAGFAATTLSLAATESIATAATYALGTALNVALAGIPALIGGIVVAAGALVAVLGNMDAITSSAKGAFNGLKQAGQALFDALVTIGVPVWNTFVDLIEIILAPIFAVMDAVNRLATGLGLIGKEGSVAGGILSGITSILGLMAEAVAFVVRLFQGPFSFIADIIYQAVAIPLNLIVDIILYLADIVGFLIGQFMQLSIVQQGIQLISQWIQRATSMFSAFADMVGGAVGFAENMLEGLLNFFIRGINDIIQTYNNKMPVKELRIGTLQTVDFSGVQNAQQASQRLQEAQASAAETQENAAQLTSEDKKNAQSSITGGGKVVNNTYKKNEYNFGDFNMKPEEKARVKGLVQEAIEEANRTKRIRDGGV